MLFAGIDVTTCLTLETQTPTNKLPKVATKHCFQQSAIASPSSDTTHTGKQLVPNQYFMGCSSFQSHLEQSITGGVTTAPTQSQNYALHAIWRYLNCQVVGMMDFQLGYTNCLNHINTPSQQVERLLLLPLTLKHLKPMTVFPLG